MASKIEPNRGASVPDFIAVGEGKEILAEWQKRCGIKKENQIRLVKLSHMRYQHPDLENITTFLLNFGMEVAQRTEDEIWFRGYGSDQYVYYARKGPKEFLGAAFQVERYQDIEKASQLPTAGEIQEMKDAPGVTYGTSRISREAIINHENEKPRALKFQRFDPGPAAVHKLGHFGLCVQPFQEMVDFYTVNFNIAPTDFLYLEKDGEKQNVAMFAHIDRGQDLVDHHTFFLTSNPTTHVHHCSFEVHDYDTQHLGHQWLAKQGYESVWGVGRHILGSQIFDYWWDTTGNMIEHYADGDLVNENTPIGYGPAGHESLAVWGPEVPASFLN
uniref:Metapyrocatechase 2 n=1 Tax=Talaromyces marneffei PM1 TaxID=1077442 RepID=A0A093V2A5_TALMA